MKQEGLLKAPELDNPKKYLKSGSRTVVTPAIMEASNEIVKTSKGNIIRDILVWMHGETERLRDDSDPRKFKRTAEEIMKSKQRTGCCDSSTLFAALARSKGIPAIQIIAFKKGPEGRSNVGHYFTACYIKNSSGKSEWVYVDSDKTVDKPESVRIEPLTEDRNLMRGFYAFAYVNDYSELGIDSIPKMQETQEYAYDNTDKSDFSVEPEK